MKIALVISIAVILTSPSTAQSRITSRPYYCALLSDQNQDKNLKKVLNDFVNANPKWKTNSFYVCRNLRPGSNTYELLAYWKEREAIFFIYSTAQITDWQLLLVWSPSESFFKGARPDGEKDLVSKQWAQDSIRVATQYGTKIIIKR